MEGFGNSMANLKVSISSDSFFVATVYPTLMPGKPQAFEKDLIIIKFWNFLISEHAEVDPRPWYTSSITKIILYLLQNLVISFISSKDQFFSKGWDGFEIANKDILFLRN